MTDAAERAEAPRNTASLVAYDTGNGFTAWRTVEPDAPGLFVFTDGQ
jgi:hypothetical protein